METKEIIIPQGWVKVGNRNYAQRYISSQRFVYEKALKESDSIERQTVFRKQQ